MLRAAKRIDIETDIKSRDGFIFAPIICLGGIVLRSDRKIPSEISEFLSNKTYNL